MSASASASSSLISITPPSNSSSQLHASKTLRLQISIPNSHFKTPNFSFNFKPNYSHLSTPVRSSSPSYEAIQLEQTPDSELSSIEEELETDIDDYDEEEEDDENEPESPEAGKLYVGNLPYAITSSELAQCFGEAGNVNYVEVRICIRA